MCYKIISSKLCYPSFFIFKKIFNVFVITYIYLCFFYNYILFILLRFFLHNSLRRTWMSEQQLLFLDAQASSFLINFCDLQDTMPTHWSNSHFPPNPYLGKIRISLGVTSIVSMCFCLHI